MPLLGALKAKLFEAAMSVAPIALIVAALALSVAPLPLPALTLFVLCAAVLVVGMALFALGAQIAMTPMGEMVGARMTQSRSLRFLIGMGFLMGAIITVAEPDLTVLATQVPAFPTQGLILSVAAGVGAFLVAALLRIVLQKRLNVLLIAFYGVVFLLAVFSNNDFLPVAFDSGGVTTGPITVPVPPRAGRGRRGRARRQDRRRRQLWPGGAVLDRPDPGGAFDGHVL